MEKTDEERFREIEKRIAAIEEVQTETSMKVFQILDVIRNELWPRIRAQNQEMQSGYTRTASEERESE